jgi:hypothetical protein
MKNLEDWIDSLKKSHPDLKGHSICPFASKSTYKIIKCSINAIKPLDENVNVIIFVVEDDLDLDYGYKKIEELSKKYSEYEFIDDFRDVDTFINGIQTNNTKYNLIICQNSEFLSKMRKILAKTDYYDLWDDKYLKEVLGNDYKIVQKIRNE